MNKKIISHKPRPAPSDYNIFDYCHDEFVAKIFSVNMITLAYMNWQSVELVHERNILREYFNSTKNLSEEEKAKKISQFKSPKNSLLDSIIISVCFENYFKSKLMLNGVVIHESKDRIVSRKQKNRPLWFGELDASVDLKFTLKDKTINYSTLLNKTEYNKLLGLSKETINYLKELNERRNKLHSYMYGEFYISNYELDMIDNLNEIVNIDFCVLQNALIESLDGISRTKLPLPKLNYSNNKTSNV